MAPTDITGLTTDDRRMTGKYIASAAEKYTRENRKSSNKRPNVQCNGLRRNQHR